MTKNGETRADTIDLDRTEGEMTDSGQEDIVVELPYVELVARCIRDFKVAADPDWERMSPALGLGVVVVQDIKKLADALDPLISSERQEPHPKTPPKTNLDKALVGLRQVFYAAHDEWVPVMGKNRTVRGVHGTPHIGGGGYPKALGEVETVPELQLQKPPTVKVGLIDTPVYRHEEFHDRVKIIGRGELHPRECTKHKACFKHLDIHATFSVGLILKEAPAAEVIVRAVLRHDDAKATAWDVAEAMAAFIDDGVSLVVLPLVCFTADGQAPLALQRAVDLLTRYGIAVVAAAGNHGESLRQDGKPTNTWRGFPAACPGAFSVGAADEDGKTRAAYNPKRGSWIKLAGPGTEVVSTSVDGWLEYMTVDGYPPPPRDTALKGHVRWSGTSFATATVGGAIAARITQDRSVFAVIDDLERQDPKSHGGIGRYEDLTPPS